MSTPRTTVTLTDTGVPHHVLTHLIPAPRNDKNVASFADDVRSGGYQATISVGRDLDEFVVS